MDLKTEAQLRQELAYVWAMLDAERAAGAAAVVAAETARRRRAEEILYHERERARAQVEYAGRLLAGIHALLYPPPIKLADPDGRTMVFRPKDPDPHTILQELSDRIRALPDELARLDAITHGTGITQMSLTPDR